MTWHIGRGLSVVAEDEQGVELEGPARLSPGRAIVLVGVASAPARGRRAYVASWRVLRLARGGLIYRGYCVWLRDEQGTGATVGARPLSALVTHVPHS